MLHNLLKSEYNISCWVILIKIFSNKCEIEKEEGCKMIKKNISGQIKLATSYQVRCPIKSV
jgi:hypothetical protein